MASLDSIAPDQRAVLQLVLQRGRSYDEIAQMLSIDRAAVRQRALNGLDALGPQTGIDDQRRALITDYLLGQLPPAVAADTRDQLAGSPAERAWARVIASELATIASEPLPEIPVSSERARVSAAQSAPEQAAAVAAAAGAGTTAEGEAAAATALGQPPSSGGQGPPRSSRIGGLVLIGVAVIAAIVVVVVLVTSGGSNKSPVAAGSSHSSTAASVSSSTTASSSSAAKAKVIAQINLKAPDTGSKAAGIAEVLKEGANNGIAIVADHVTPNTTKPPNAYAVWLYNSSSDAQLLGFVNPGVGKTGRLSTAGGLPSNAAHFKQLIVTRETKADPKTPGTIILQGLLSGL